MRRKNKRKKRKTISNKSIICITTITMLNAMGISYGLWSEDSKIDFKIFTGNIDPCFTKIEVSENEDTGNYYDIQETKDGQIIAKIEHSYTIKDDLDSEIHRKCKDAKIKGTVIGEDEHTLYIDVENNGTVPIKLCDVENGSLDREVEIEPRKRASIKINGVTIESGKDNEDIILIFEQSI